jgi:hypothetical protein
MRSVRTSAASGGEIVVGAPQAVSSRGLRQADGTGPDYLNDAAVGYLPAERAFVVVRPVHPSRPEKTVAKWQEVDVIAARDIADGTWRKVAVIGPALTKAPRNHNAGIVKDVWGALPRADRIGVVVTTSEECCFPATLWTNRLHEVDLPFSFPR